MPGNPSLVWQYLRRLLAPRRLRAPDTDLKWRKDKKQRSFALQRLLLRPHRVSDVEDCVTMASGRDVRRPYSDFRDAFDPDSIDDSRRRGPY